MQTLQRAAGTAFSLSLAALIVFWTIKNTEPSGAAVFPILYGALMGSALVWLLAALRRRDEAAERGGSIRAGDAISAGGHISAAADIEAGQGIRAGGNIHSGTMNPLLRRLFYEHKGRRSVLEEMERDSHKPSAVPTETVTPATIEHELASYIPVAAQLLTGDLAQAQVDSWASGAGVVIRVRGPIGEEEMFLIEGNNLDPRAELRAKVARLQNHILPKVMAGEWTR